MSPNPAKIQAVAQKLFVWMEARQARVPGRRISEPMSLSYLAGVSGASEKTTGYALTSLGWTKKTIYSEGLERRVWVPPTNPVPPAPPVEAPKVDHEAVLKARVRVLETQLASDQKSAVTEEAIRRKIINLREAVESAPPPQWVLAPLGKADSPGVPTLFLSDLHWGEVVQPTQIGGVNSYDLATARDRLHRAVSVAVHLLEILDPKWRYPGIVVPLGGDMISGNIHDELTATNELNTMPTVVDLYSELRGVISNLADKFGRVFLPCVSGNHGRDTRKIWSKDRHATSFDWLLYILLAKHFEGDKRVTFLIPDGPDALYSIYGYRYLLTHGDQFRGGDGVIGALGPIIRGDHRKRSRNSQVDMAYDTMLLGHWHQYMHLTRLIVNGCFPAGSPVTLADGTTRPIEQVRVGDEVVTRQGNTKRVLDSYSRDNAKTLVVVRCGTKSSELALTPNHKVWAVKGSSVGHLRSKDGGWVQTTHAPAPRWIEAENLSAGDYVEIPCARAVEDNTEFDRDFCGLLGWYLAEGSASGRQGKLQHLDFSLHRAEESYAEFIYAQCERRFGKAAHVFPKHPSRQNSRTVAVYSSEAAEYMVGLAGKGAGQKCLRADLMRLPPEKQESILLGWLQGDGHTTQSGRFRREKFGIVVSGASISRSLIEQMRTIALRCGYFASVNTLSPGAGGRRKNTAYSLLFTGDTARNLARRLGEYVPETHDAQCDARGDFKVLEHEGVFFARVTDAWVVAHEGPVFNLTVEDDSTYVVNGVGVANSLKGYDEYAYNNNFPFEPPQQALWVTHPKHGITYRMPVKLSESTPKADTPWVSWKETK